jgi:hypothetical protein
VRGDSVKSTRHRRTDASDDCARADRREAAACDAGGVTARYRLRSEEPVEGTDTWEVRWHAVPPADGPPVIWRVSRETFLLLDATGLLDSSCLFSADSLASFLSHPVRLRVEGMRS